MTIQEKAEQYAREKHGRSATGGIDKVNSAQDYTAGYNEAKRWIPVGERLPEYHKEGKSKEVFCKQGNHIFVGYYDLDNKEFGKIGGNRFYSVDEWREI